MAIRTQKECVEFMRRASLLNQETEEFLRVCCVPFTAISRHFQYAFIMGRAYERYKAQRREARRKRDAKLAKARA